MKFIYSRELESPMLETKYVTESRCAGKLESYRIVKINVDVTKKIKAVSLLIRKTHRGNLFGGIRLLDQRDKAFVDKVWDSDAQG